MKSLLIITAVEKLQREIIYSVRQSKNSKEMGIYLSLNKTQKSTEDLFKKSGIDTKKLFFIDCVTSEKSCDDVLHIPPHDLDTLVKAATIFLKEIHGKKCIFIDALSTLLIYNSENKVAGFVQEMIQIAAENSARIIAFSPETRGEELLEKIYNFFDEVKKI
jgi:hypothetical protein